MADISVLFVCTGNICRSPSAEGVFRALLARAGLAERVAVDSAGIGDWHAGEPPDARSQAAALRRGYDLSAQRARALRRADCNRHDYLIAMDEGHLEALRRLCRRARATTALLLDFAPEAPLREVPDPYYGGERGFEDVLDLIERGAEGLLAEVRQRLEGG